MKPGPCGCLFGSVWLQSAVMGNVYITLVLVLLTIWITLVLVLLTIW